MIHVMITQKTLLSSWHIFDAALHAIRKRRHQSFSVLPLKVISYIAKISRNQTIIFNFILVTQLPNPPPLSIYSNERFSLNISCAVPATINGLCYYNFTIVLICRGKSNPFASVMARLYSLLSRPQHSQTLNSQQIVVRTKQAAISTRCFLMSLQKWWWNYENFFFASIKHPKLVKLSLYQREKN